MVREWELLKFIHPQIWETYWLFHAPSTTTTTATPRTGSIQKRTELLIKCRPLTFSHHHWLVHLDRGGNSGWRVPTWFRDCSQQYACALSQWLTIDARPARRKRKSGSSKLPPRSKEAAPRFLPLFFSNVLFWNTKSSSYGTLSRRWRQRQGRLTMLSHNVPLRRHLLLDVYPPYQEAASPPQEFFA